MRRKNEGEHTELKTEVITCPMKLSAVDQILVQLLPYVEVVLLLNLIRFKNIHDESPERWYDISLHANGWKIRKYDEDNRTLPHIPRRGWNPNGEYKGKWWPLTSCYDTRTMREREIFSWRGKLGRVLISDSLFPLSINSVKSEAERGLGERKTKKCLLFTVKFVTVVIQLKGTGSKGSLGSLFYQRRSSLFSRSFQPMPTKCGGYVSLSLSLET